MIFNRLRLGLLCLEVFCLFVCAATGAAFRAPAMKC